MIKIHGITSHLSQRSPIQQRMMVMMMVTMVTMMVASPILHHMIHIVVMLTPLAV